jgi:argininosuccinate synthase
LPGPIAGWLAGHNQKDAEGFIRLNGLRLRTGAKRDQR